MKRFLPLICFFLFLFFCIRSAEGQDSLPAGEKSAEEIPLASGNAEDSGAAEAGAAKADAAKEENPDKEYIGMDIKTSTLIELAAWCRELGLSEGGAREDLAARLRTYYKLPPGKTAAAEQRIITIESAKTTEYFTLEVVDEEYARLRGDVIISLKDGNAVHRIKAWEILYNRTRNVMTASGKVEYVKEDGDTIETFKGESITVNLDNWSSIFMDGVSEKSIAGNNTAYRFAGTVISRNSEEVTVLTGADITNPRNEEAYWSLHASKLWLLPGNDWAIFNAVLKVGNIPLLYLPFFYYPSDEIIFHPVLGTRSREGTFLQTTTYILGRPKTEAVSENSITKIFGSSSGNMEKKREGVFLRTTGQKRTDPNDTRLSVLFDAYVNLGAYLGTELALPRKKFFGDFNLSTGLGLTRNIYAMADSNTPFRNYDGTSEWNKAMLFSWEIPFRYRFNMTGSFQLKKGSFSWAIPYYSDPYVDRDFMRRTEVLDWLTMLREGASASDDESSRDTSLGSFEWRLNGSINPSFPVLAPYINSISISSISSNLQFNNRHSARYEEDPFNPLSPPNPGRAFFIPQRFTMYSISASVSGIPYSTGSPKKTNQTGTGSSSSSSDKPAPEESPLPDIPRSPWESEKIQEGSDQLQADGDQARNQFSDIYTYSPPALSQTFNFPSSGRPGFSIDYRLSPTTASELQFRSSQANWKEQEDINWGDVSTILSRFRGDASIGFNLDHSGGGAYSGALRFDGSGSWQDYMLLNDESEDFIGGEIDVYSSIAGIVISLRVSEGDIVKAGEIIVVTDAEEIRASRKGRVRLLVSVGATVTNRQQVAQLYDMKILDARDRAYSETMFNSSWDLTATVKPFFQSTIWNGSSLQYRVRGLLSKTEVDTTGGSPEWDWVYGKWDKDDIESHQVTATASATIMDKNQNLSISTVLPPKDALLSGSAAFNAWISTTSANTSIKEPWDSDLRTFEPIYITERLTFNSWANFRQYFVIDPEDKGLTTSTSELGLSGFTASYSMVYARPYRYNPQYGPSSPVLWIQTDDSNQPLEEKLVPRELRLGYSNTFSPKSFWKDRLKFSFDINTNLIFNLQQYTSSRMDFRLGFNIGIVNFLDLKFSTSSENSVIYRYFQKLPFFDSPPVDLYSGYETNFFLDLFNSFRFGNEEERKKSGFKLKSMNLSLIHHLGDWNAKLSINMTPYLDQTGGPPYSYRFSNEISFLIQWVPIGEIKTNIEYKDEYLSIK